MGKKVLITGASGFLGSYITGEFLDSDWKILAIDRNSFERKRKESLRGVHYKSLSLPSAQLKEIVSGFAPDACIHCAGRASVAESVRNPQEDYESSVLLTASLIDALATGAKSCRTVFLSSAAVYGQPASLPVSEKAQSTPLSPYGYHKRICELLMEQASRLRGVPTVALRIFSAYGPGLSRQVLWEIASQFATKGKATLKGSGRETRDFIHAADVAKAVRLVVEKAPFQGEIYNLATEQETSIRDAAEILGGFFGKPESIVFEGGKTPGDPERWVADCTRIRELGFEPSVPLQQGLYGLAEWVSK